MKVSIYPDCTCNLLVNQKEYKASYEVEVYKQDKVEKDYMPGKGFEERKWESTHAIRFRFNVEIGKATAHITLDFYPKEYPKPKTVLLSGMENGNEDDIELLGGLEKAIRKEIFYYLYQREDMLFEVSMWCLTDAM